MPRTPRSPGPAARRTPLPLAADEGATAHIPSLGGSRKEAHQARSRETIAAILEAATRLLVESGYPAASTNAIARRAGVSIGSLYQYFESREDIFRTLMARHTAEIHACAARILQPVIDGEQTAAQALPGLLSELLALHRGNPDLARAMATELAHLDTGTHHRQEARALDEMAACVAARLPGPIPRARAKAWVASEITAHLTRRLAHAPPATVETEEVLAVFAELMGQLLA